MAFLAAESGAPSVIPPPLAKREAASWRQSGQCHNASAPAGQYTGCSVQLPASTEAQKRAAHVEQERDTGSWDLLGIY